MSGPGDDRWRSGRPFDQNRQSGQRNSTAGPRDRNNGAQDTGRSGHNSNQANSWSGSREQGPAGLTQEQHVPVRGFNSAEAKAALKKDVKLLLYTPNKEALNNRASGPWGARPNMMANGKDFFLELRKQISTLQQGNTAPGG